MFKPKFILIAVLAITLHQSASAATIDQSCSARGFTEGAACTGAAAMELRSSCTEMDSSRPCIIINCAAKNQCVCGYSVAEACGGGGGGGGTTCDYPCPSVGINTWEIVLGENYQRKISSYLQNISTCECTPRYTYRCNAGYYSDGLILIGGNPPDCVRCPATGLIPATGSLLNSYGTSDPGASMITSCYISSDSSFKDSKGSFNYSENCNYNEDLIAL